MLNKPNRGPIILVPWSISILQSFAEFARVIAFRNPRAILMISLSRFHWAWVRFD